jgi:uncharacterized protein (DUF58 family)
MNLRLIAGIALGAAAAVSWVANCSGPAPAVDGASVRLIEPGVEGAPYQVEAVVRNTRRGHGEVVVNARLHDRASGLSARADREVTLGAHETVLVVVDVQAPRGSYVPEVTVEYPPR